MNQYFCPSAIDEPNFQLSELKEYYIPPDGDLQSYKARIAFKPPIVSRVLSITRLTRERLQNP